jgi:hypothetical protein
MELEDAFKLKFQLVAHILTSFPMEYAFPIALLHPMLIVQSEFAHLAQPTASPVFLILSAMLVAQDTILKTVFALLQQPLAQAVNLDIMELAMQHAQLELAQPVTTVKEFAQLDHGHIMEDATDNAPLIIQLTMLVLMHALLEPL